MGAYNVCKTCKYWRKNRNVRGWDPETDHFVLEFDLGVCSHKKLQEYEGDVHALDVLIFSGAYGHESTLEVGPDFGCIHHHG